MAANYIEIGQRFTIDTYATKEEVQAIYNQTNIGDIWKNVLTYRSFYDVETDLKDINSLSYKICLNRKILGLSFNLHTSLNNDLIKFILLPKSLQQEYLLQKKIDALKNTAMSINCNVTENTLRKLVKDELENIPSDLFVLKAYLDGYEFSSQIESITVANIEKINNIVSGNESPESKAKYRQNAISDIINPLFAPGFQDISSHLQNLVLFLTNNDIPSILRALSIPYVFSYLRPFEYYNEETAALIAKAFLSTHGFGLTGFSLNFESLCYANSKNFFDTLKNVEKTLDLTYILNRFLAFVINDEENISNLLKELTIQKQSFNLNEETEQESTEDIQPNKKFALPTFPIKDNLETIEARARKLREVHPQLKRKQAHFYAGHCTIGLHYTIEQFKTEEHTVYETARTSMEDLANRGFYKKEYIGKKFVYTPIPLNEEDSSI